MKRTTIFITAILSTSLLLAGCTANSAVSPLGQPTTVQTVASSDSDLAPEAVMAENADYTTVNTDEWSEADAVVVRLSGDGLAGSAEGVSSNDGTVTIAEAGVYRLSGSLDGQIIVDAADDALVVLLLDGVEVASPSGAAIEIANADDVAIHLADGSENRVSDAVSDDSATAAISSASDLTISGSGSLTVTGEVNDGIASKDDLVVLGGSISVTAVDDALRGKDSLVIEGGELDLTAGGDGMKSDGDEGDTEIDWTRGYVYVSGGEISVEAGDDGLQAFTDAVIVGGSLVVNAVDDGVKGEVIVSIGQTSEAAASVTVTASTEGIEAANIGISGGEVDVTASDDGLNASGNAELQALIDGTETSAETSAGGGEFADTGERLEISGGTVTVDAEGDGLDSNGSLTISGGNSILHGPTTGGNGSLDANGTLVITGGTLVTFGPGDMEQTPSTDGQGWVLIDAQLTAGASGTIVDASGSVVAEFTSKKTASSVIFSSADISMGESYTVTVDGQELGSATAGEGGMAGGPGGAGGGPDGEMPPQGDGPDGEGGGPDGGQPRQGVE